MGRPWEGKPPKMDAKKAEVILKEVKKVLDANNVPFFLCFATCLGAVREGGFIDIDFDIDIGIRHNDLMPKLKDLKFEFERLGYDTKYLSTPYSYDRMLKLDKDEVRVDLVNWDLCDGYYFHPVEPDGKCHIFPQDMFDSLEGIEFLGDIYYIPQPVGEYLRLLYGNWRVKDENYNFRNAESLRMNYWNEVVVNKIGDRI